MIPALFAAPTVASAVGGVLGGVVNSFVPSAPTPRAPPFNPYIDRVATPSAPSTNSPGTLRAEDWGQMDPTSVKSWAQGLQGHHIFATDASGRAVSGVVDGVTQLGNTLALNVSGKLVSLSQLKQVTWSSSIA